MPGKRQNQGSNCTTMTTQRSNPKEHCKEQGEMYFTIQETCPPIKPSHSRVNSGRFTVELEIKGFSRSPIYNPFGNGGPALTHYSETLHREELESSLQHFYTSVHGHHGHECYRCTNYQYSSANLFSIASH